ncbi:hypothetical protein P5673_018185 [Acropora cervicornis]|uniref:Uncharacterized protein n=1 Tax=Acropora cervicornis TaxID=6130 RepID=A0AAD9QE07_ACRCE|nr:hypothetical protein P5673_018185 [Acropora cervicornis]
MSLTEKLLRVQNDLEESEGKMSQMYKSMEMKQVEIERLKVQADNAKKATDIVKDLKADVTAKETELQKANKTIAELELTVGHLEDKQERDFERNKKMKEENQKSKDDYEGQIRDQQQYIADLRSDLKHQYDSQVKELVGSHQRELTQLRDDHKVELNRMQKALDVARRKGEELKAELSESSKRNSVAAAESGSSKCSSLFSPEGSDGGESPRKLSLKSSAQTVRLLNKARTMSDVGSSSEHSDSPSTPLNKSTTPSQTSPAVDVTKENSNDNPTGKLPVRKVSKSDKSKKEKSVKGTPEKSVISKSPSDKPQAVVEPFEKSIGSEGSSESNQIASLQPSPAEIQVTTSVEMVDVGIQSESEEFNDTEMNAYAWNTADRKPSFLQVVPEEEHEDDELEMESLSREQLVDKLEDYRAKSQERQRNLEMELAELKNKYIVKTNSLKKQNEESQNSFLREKEAMLSKLREAENLKEQAERKAEEAFLQLRQLKEKALRDKQTEETMTGLSLYSRREEEAMTSGSLVGKEEKGTLTSKSSTNMQEEHTMTSMSLGTDREESAVDFKGHSVGTQSSRQSSDQLLDAGTESEQLGERGLSPRDSGFDGTASSVKFDSRPSSAVTTTVSKVETEKPLFGARPSVTVKSDFGLFVKAHESETTENKGFMLSPPVEKRPVMSANARRRLINSALNGHPVAKETLKTYDAVLQFTETVVLWLVREGLDMEASQVKNLKPIALNKEEAMQIIERMPEIRDSVCQILNQLASVLSSQHLARSTAAEAKSVGLSTSQKTLPLLSSRPEWRPKSVKKEDVVDTATQDFSYVKLLKEYNDLAEGYERLQQHMDEETKFHQEQTSQNVAVMTDMQDTITQLRNQLAELKNTRPPSSARTSSSIMFTRLDAERNSKILKRAVNERRLSDDSFSVIMEHMDHYVSLPAQRLAHIVRRYSHHRSMKEIERSLKHGGVLDEGVFSTLDKMESLQNKRAERWGDKMDKYASERERLAKQLTTCFENLEQETGIFLIKPVYSFKGRSEEIPGYVVTQRHKPSPPPPKPSGPATPAPTPWLQLAKEPLSAGLFRDLTQSSLTARPSSIPTMSKMQEGEMKMRVARSVDKDTLKNRPSAMVTWQMSKSHVTDETEESIAVELNTPRILELDVNRVMFGQADVSKSIVPLNDSSNFKLTASVVRSYVTVERPTGGKQIRKANQQKSGKYNSTPPNTTQDPSGGPMLSHYPPLPPIHMPKLRQESRSGKSRYSDAGTFSEAGSPVAGRHEDISPSSPVIVHETPEQRRLSSPDILPVR